MENVKAIILAAGEGSRMKSKKAKVLHEIFNKSMISYVIDVVKDNGIDDVAIVVGHKSDEVENAIKEDGYNNVSFHLQQEQKGTGHAVMMANDFIEDDKDILILYGDTPLIDKKTMEFFITKHQESKAGVSLIVARAVNPAGYGRVLFDKKGEFIKIVEEKDATGRLKAIKEVNTGIYIFKGKVLKNALENLKNDNAQKEYYLTDCLEWIKNNGSNIFPLISPSMDSYFGVNTREQLATATKIMQRRIVRKHMIEGVTFDNPDSVYIHPQVVIGQDTTILSGCYIEGDTVIGEDCLIGPYTRLKDMKIGDNVEIQSSTAVESTMGDDCVVGPYAYIRPNCTIGNSVKIGDFVEVKNSVIGNGTKIPHLSYVGDTDAGYNINFGCGSIMVNYDGEKKHRTVINDGAFIGCNVNLVAPVTVGEKAFVSAGSTITKNVSDDVLVFARSHEQIEKKRKK